MLYSYGRFLLPHLPLDRDAPIVNVGDEVELQYYRLERVFSGAIDLREGEAQYVKSPTEVGTGKAKDEQGAAVGDHRGAERALRHAVHRRGPPLLPADQGKACKNEQVIQTALANPLDKFELGIRKLIEDFMIERMGENDKIVTRYMADREFQGSAFPILAREIFHSIRADRAEEVSTTNS